MTQKSYLLKIGTEVNHGELGSGIITGYNNGPDPMDIGEPKYIVHFTDEINNKITVEFNMAFSDFTSGFISL